MNKAIVGKKIGMSQVFLEDGVVVPVTVVEAGPCPIIQKKTQEKDGYEALQVAFGTTKKSTVTKPIAGHFAKMKATPQRYLRELRLADCSAYETGQEIVCDIFEAGNRVDVQGTSKGHGFTGPIKRWNFSMGPAAHGSGYHRGVGALSANSSPGKVFKNRKMAGQYGCEKVTVQNLEIVKVIKENNLLLIKGSIPGPKGSLVIIKESCKKTKRGK